MLLGPVQSAAVPETCGGRTLTSARRAIWTFFLCVPILHASCRRTETAAERPGKVETPPVELVIEKIPAEVIAGERFLVRVSLRNVTDSPIWTCEWRGLLFEESWRVGDKEFVMVPGRGFCRQTSHPGGQTVMHRDVDFVLLPPSEPYHVHKTALAPKDYEGPMEVTCIYESTYDAKEREETWTGRLSATAEVLVRARK